MMLFMRQKTVEGIEHAHKSKGFLMDISLSTWMMAAFVIFMILGVWKIYAFLPTKQLEDDDKTEDSEHELIKLMINVIKKNHGTIDNRELFIKMQEDENFDSKLFWRFNHNRLNQLLSKYYILYPECSSIEDIYRLS